MTSRDTIALPSAQPQADASRLSTADSGAAVLRKVMLRLIPFLFVAYVVCYIDRVNVGFAALSMNKDIGLSPTVFGFGSGLFFIGYFLFEVPSNLLMQRFGARLWISRIMVSWGIIAVASAFVTGPYSYSVSRFLLGLAEAGFTPGIFLFFTMWFPGAARARATAIFMTSVPVANIVGSLISGSILKLGGIGGLKDWQTLLVLEALPAIILGVLCFFILDDRPGNAKWLTSTEANWLEGELARERTTLAARHGDSLRSSIRDGRVYLLAGIYFCYIVGSVGIGIWLPQIVKGFGLPPFQVGIITAIPYACGAIWMIVWSRIAGDGNRRLPFAIGAICVAAFMLAFAGLTDVPVLKMAAIVLTVTFMLGFQAIFLALPSTFLTGRAAAGGLAIIISIGNLGGFVGPYLVGFVWQATGSSNVALLAIAAALMLATVATFMLGDPAQRSRG